MMRFLVLGSSIEVYFVYFKGLDCYVELVTKTFVMFYISSRSYLLSNFIPSALNFKAFITFFSNLNFLK